MGWEEWVDLWVLSMAAVGLSRATLKRRRCCIFAFSKVAGVLPGAVTRLMVERWLATMTAARTRRAYYSDLALFFAWWSATTGAPSPMIGMPRPREPRALPRPICLAMLEGAVRLAGEPLATWIMLGALAGLRVSEIARLHTDDIGDGVIVVRDGKGSKDRAVPIHPALAVHLATFGAGWIAPGDLGHVTAETVSGRITRHLRGCGIDATAHALRHTFGTETARATNGDVTAVAALMGHSSVSTTMAYVALAADRQRQVVASLAWAS